MSGKKKKTNPIISSSNTRGLYSGRTINIFFKNIIAFFLNALILWLGWNWIIVSIFNLPPINYLIWVALGIIQLRLHKNIGDYGISTMFTRDRIPDRRVDTWIELIITYGFTIGIIWCCYYFIIVPTYL